MSEKTLEELEKEIEDKKEQVKKQSKELATASVKKIFESGILKTRHWKVSHFLRGSILLIPVGKNENWPKVSNMIPESEWWSQFYICDGVILHRFDDIIRLGVSDENPIDSIKSLGITVEYGNIREQIEGAERGVKFEQHRVEVLSSIETICTGKSYREYS